MSSDLSQTFPRPVGKPTFTLDWFLWFAQNLTLPEGSPWRWEGHTLLMAREFFAPELVHLLVCIPKSNQKTTWEAALADWHLLSVKAPRVYAGAADKEQAQELYDFAAHFIESEPELEARLLVRESIKTIRLREGRGLFKILASDDSKGGGKRQGKNTTLTELDELHAHENDNLFTDFRSAGFKRREAARVAGDPLWWTVGKMATITTAGWDQESALWRELVKFLGDHKRGIPPMGSVQTGMRVLPDGTVESHPTGRLTIARYGNGRNVLLLWASTQEDDPDDFEQVKLANPASTVTLESLQDARESLTPWSYERYRMNRWTLAFESWIPVGAWEGLVHPDVPVVEHRDWLGAPNDELDAHIASLYPAGSSLVGAQDMARYRDSAAATVIGPGPDGLAVPRSIIWRSGGRDNPVPYGAVERAWEQLHEHYNLEAVGFDQMYFGQAAENLEGKGLPMEPVSQSNAVMCPAAADLRTDILGQDGRVFAHDGDPYLAAHIMAATAKDVGDGLFKLVKSKDSGPPIDGCISLVMANMLRRYRSGIEPVGAWA